MVTTDTMRPFVRFDKSGTVTQNGPLGLIDGPALDGERTTLKTSSRPLGRLVAVLLFTLFWNGVISVFVVEAVKAAAAPGKTLVTGLFLTPFVLVGLGLIVLLIRQALMLMSPRPEVTVSSARVPMGSTVQIDWSLRGRTGRVQRLTLELEGREEATYTRGTDSHTDHEVFAKIPIGEWSGRECEQGTSEVMIPARTMHSFTGRHNRVHWQLQVKGEIPRWPDIDETYPLLIVPE